MILTTTDYAAYRKSLSLIMLYGKKKSLMFVNATLEVVNWVGDCNRICFWNKVKQFVANFDINDN